MSATAADTIDSCQARLHAEGFSIGDMAVRSIEGAMWVVFAHRGDEQLVAKARTQATMLYLLGIDHEKLTYRYSGRDLRLTDLAGVVAKGVIA